ncbi:MAG: DMT family transporter [Pseudomonadota bacterium]|nr:DMT family transporter [Pseudomonadota bacterium]
MSDRATVRATLTGIGAVLSWALLALLTDLSGQVPPLQLTAMSFGVAFALALVLWARRGQNPLRRLRQPAGAWILGVAGLFGYHAMYFVALRNAPVVEASLIAYLWPLLIVLFAALLPGQRLRLIHVAGALAGFAGAVLIVARAGLSFDPRFTAGYLAASACALIWSGYSVLNRRFAGVPTDVVGGFCGVTAVGATALHLAFEVTVWPVGAEWLAVFALGLGPVGGAFFLWDIGTKRGDLRVLGAAAYLAPLLSTVILVAAGATEATWRVALACLLITGGAALASSDMLRRRDHAS